jgi:hypothetical protein
MTATELLARILAITPAPPMTDDVEVLLAAAAEVHAARELLLAAASPVMPAPLDPARRSELEARQQAWTDALSSAQRRVGGQRVGAGQLRRYATHL